jgi:hypothetical protein
MTKFTIDKPENLPSILINYVMQTRKFGSCYVHTAVRMAVDFTWCHKVGDVAFSINSYGRSLQVGGHKYKVAAKYWETGKPVPSKVLKEIAA